MDYLFANADAAEDLPNGKTILIVHVVHRGYNLGTFLGLGSALVVTATKAVRGGKKSPTGLSPGVVSPWTGRLLRYTARGSLVGLAFGALAVTGRMWGRELIEWQDRSWRLMNHATQTQTDHWSIVGAAVGASTGVLFARRLAQPYTTAGAALLRPRTIVLGSAATGSALAIIAMLGVRALVQSGQNAKAMS